MSRQKTLVLATHNKHKQEEMTSILSKLSIRVLGLDPFPDIGDIEETGTTLEENAFIKARTVFQKTGLPSLADDTGLEVDALQGAPGVFSARYAGKNATFLDNVNKMLTELNGVPNSERTAKFRTVLALVDNETEQCEEGVVIGEILNEIRGDDGFGYDPIFKPINSHLSYAEMNSTEKNKMSHRARALEKMKPILTAHFNKGETID